MLLTISTNLPVWVLFKAWFGETILMIYLRVENRTLSHWKILYLKCQTFFLYVPLWYCPRNIYIGNDRNRHTKTKPHIKIPRKYIKKAKKNPFIFWLNIREYFTFVIKYSIYFYVFGYLQYHLQWVDYLTCQTLNYVLCVYNLNKYVHMGSSFDLTFVSISSTLKEHSNINWFWVAF